MTPLVKICGLKTPETVLAAEDADYLGFMFYSPSPRNIAPADAAKLKQLAHAETVAVTVDANDALLEEIFSVFMPDLIQLHGSESIARIREIKKKFHVPVIKAINISSAADLKGASEYEKETDFLLFDTKSSDGTQGGTGKSFDWNILAGRKFSRPYFLSGGLNADNVEKALRISGAIMVDVSSGVESSRGSKDPKLVTGFINTVKGLST